MKIVTMYDQDFKNLVRARLFSLGGLSTPGHIEYFKNYYGFNFTDLSFGVIHPNGEVICLLTRHVVDGLTHFGWYGQPAKIICRGTGEKQSQAEQAAQTYLSSLLQDGVFIDFQEPAGEMSFFSKTLLQMGINPRICPEQILRIVDDELMLRDMRKVFRQNIKWGIRNLSCVVLDAESITEDDFLRFEAFHIAVAGRRTRSHSSWLTQLKLVLDGESYLVTSSLNDNLVGMSFFAASGERAYYSVGVYERGLFHHPLSHYPIWCGIRYARDIGCRELSMGESFYPGVVDSSGRITSEKECNISHFKRGFGGGIHTSVRFLGCISV